MRWILIGALLLISAAACDTQAETDALVGTIEAQTRAQLAASPVTGGLYATPVESWDLPFPASYTRPPKPAGAKALQRQGIRWVSTMVEVGEWRGAGPGEFVVDPPAGEVVLLWEYHDPVATGNLRPRFGLSWELSEVEQRAGSYQWPSGETRALDLGRTTEPISVRVDASPGVVWVVAAGQVRPPK